MRSYKKLVLLAVRRQFRPTLQLRATRNLTLIAVQIEFGNQASALAREAAAATAIATAIAVSYCQSGDDFIGPEPFRCQVFAQQQQLQLCLCNIFDGIYFWHFMISPLQLLAS